MNPRYRVPALASAGSRLCLVYDVRSSPLDLPGPHGIAVQHSLDAGACLLYTSDAADDIALV